MGDSVVAQAQEALASGIPLSSRRNQKGHGFRLGSSRRQRRERPWISSSIRTKA